MAAPGFATFTDSDAPLFALEDTDGGRGPDAFGSASGGAAPHLLTGGMTLLQPQHQPGGLISSHQQQSSPPFGAAIGGGSSSSHGAGLTAGAGGASGSSPQPQGGSGSNSHVVSLNNADAQQRNVYVASLPANFTDDNLRDLFAPYGTIVSSKMFNNDGRPGSQGRAYGFVMFADEGSVQRAIDALVGAVVGSQRIQVRRAKQTSRAPSQQASANPTPSNSTSAGQAMLLPSGMGGGQPAGLVMMPAPPQQQPQPGAVPMQGGSLTLTAIGTNQFGQSVFVTPTGQQVVLAMPHAPVAPPQQQPGSSSQPGAQPAFVMMPQQPQSQPAHTQLPPQQPAFFFR